MENPLWTITLLTSMVSQFAQWVDRERTLSDPAEAEFAAVRKDWAQAVAGYEKALSRAASYRDRQATKAEHAPKPEAFADRFVRMAETHPGTRAELAALWWAAVNAPDSAASRKALTALAGGRLARATLDDMFAALRSEHSGWAADRRPLAPLVLARAKQSLDHRRAVFLLDWVCKAYIGDESPEAPKAFTEAADLIVARFADSPYIPNLCAALRIDVPPWAGKFEPHLQTLSDKSPHRSVRTEARFAQAAAARARGADGRKQAEELFAQIVTDLDGRTRPGDYEHHFLQWARSELAEMRACGLGKPAPEIEAEDLDGEPFKLSDHRGKVVVLVFWFSSCGPCMRDVPHGRELVEQFRGRPFVLIGVNGDTNRDDARQAVEAAKIPWRSFWNGPKGDSGPIAKAWCNGWPAVYVIDHAGVIRENGLRGKKLDAPLEKLITEAEAARAGPR